MLEFLVSLDSPCRLLEYFLAEGGEHEFHAE
jgi:hypothetical protein